MAEEYDFHELKDYSDEEVDVKNAEETVPKILKRLEAYSKAQVDEFVNSAPSSEIPIVIINFSAISENDRKSELIPGEMALTAFTLQSGIIDNCAFYINHGKKISVAALNSLTKLLDLPPNTQTEDNYQIAIRILTLFREKHQYGKGRPAILFCRKLEYARVVSCLSFLFKMGGDQSGFPVIHLEYLLPRIDKNKEVNPKKCPAKETKSGSETAKILDSGNYRKSRLACSYHSENKTGLFYCPLRLVNQHAYKIIGALGDKDLSPTTSIQNWDCDTEVFKRELYLRDWDSIAERSAPTPYSRPTTLVAKTVKSSRSDEKPKKQDAQPIPPVSNPSMWNSEFYSGAGQSYPMNSAYTGWNPHMGPFTPGYSSFPPAAHHYHHHQWPTMGSCPHRPPFQYPSLPMAYYPMMAYYPSLAMGGAMMPYSYNYPPFPYLPQQPQTASPVNEPRPLFEDNSGEGSDPRSQSTNSSSHMENIRSSMSGLGLNTQNPHVGGRPQ